MSSLVPKKSNEIIDPQAQMLVNFLADMGLPSDNIIADSDQRQLIGNNLDTLIRDLPPEAKKDARYLSKFVVGAGFGLFDYSLNAIWNEVVTNLRQKAILFGLDIFFDTAVGGSKAREFYQNEEHLASIKDSVLLDSSRKLELISDTTYKKLKHILDMRNDIGISHPTTYNINAFELMGWLQTCVNEVLQDSPTEAALKVKGFVSNLRNRTDLLDSAAVKGITENFVKLPSHLCNGLLRTLFGIYVANDTDVTVRKNISLIAPALWNTCKEDSKYKLGVVLEGYNINLYKEKYDQGQQFFVVVDGNSYRSENERAIIVDSLITELRDKHNGWDNFHHEPPVAAQICSYVPDQRSILENFAHRLFQTVVMARIGNGVQYCEGVSPGAKKYYDAILGLAGDQYAPHVMASLSQFQIRNRLTNPICRKHTVTVLALVRANVINQRVIECLQYLITNIEAKPSCVSDSEFKNLSAGYIEWK